MKKTSFITLLLVPASLVVLYLTAHSFYNIVTSKAPDFTVFYGAAHNLVERKNIYKDRSYFTAFNYPPQTAVLYLPLLLVPYSLAQGFFTLLNFSLVPVSVWVSLRLIKSLVSWRLLLFLTDLAFLSFPIKFTLGMGQSNLFALSLFLLGLYFYKQKRSTLSGVVFCLSVIAKPVLLFVGLLYLFRKQWKILLVFAITILLFSLIPLFFQGPSVYQYYLTTQIPELTKYSGLDVYYNQSLLGALSRITQNPMLLKTLYALGVLVILWGTFRTLFSKEKSDSYLISRLFIALLLLNVLSWQHHFIFLLFPFIVLGGALWNANKKIKLLLLLASFFLVSLNLKDPTLFRQFPETILLSHGFFGALLLWILFLPLYDRKKY